VSWLTADLPGTGGLYKERPEDFQVEEIPLYPCSGSGEHLYLWIEKTGITTHQLRNQLKQQLQLKDREIGYAGLKDARARTRQMISVPARCASLVDTLVLRQAEILQVQLHGNKLRLGHLAGNRFTIRLRNCQPQAEQRATAILQQLEQSGVPNCFGEQRYGVLGNSAKLGMLLLQGRYQDFCRELIGDPEQIRHPEWRLAALAYRENDLEKSLRQLPNRMPDERRLLQDLLNGKGHQQAVLALPRPLLRLYLSACQSQLFDQLLEQRLPDLQRLQDGDIAYKHENGACFRVATARDEQSRAERFEISPTAPLFGYKVLQASGQPGAAEQSLLAAAGLSLENWKLPQGLAMPGERRPLRVPLQQASVQAAANSGLIIRFSLPRGSYATSVLSEIIK